MSNLSPVEVPCPACAGCGTPYWNLCRTCDGTGRAWAPGAPSYGCVITLADRKVGEIVVIGNGDRGRIVRHIKRGAPMTYVIPIDDFVGESSTARPYPSCTGVASVADRRWASDDSDHQGQRLDDQDPIRRRRAM